MADQNSTHNYWEKSFMEHFREIISNSDQLFQRRIFFKNFFMSIWYKKPPFTRAMFMDGSKFRGQFLKRVSQGTFLWNYFKIEPAVPEEKIFKELLWKFHFVAIPTRVFDGTKFCEQFLKKKKKSNLVQIGPAVWEEKMLKEIVDNRRRTMYDIRRPQTQDHPKSSP